jgi:hypothetical protein
MKVLKISLFIFTAFLVAVVASSGLVCAITSDQVYIKGIVPSQQVSIGEKVPVAVFFHNNSTETVTLDYIGVHFSWMPSETLYGYNLSSTPITVGANKDYFFPQYINVTVPAGSGGSQSFYVGVDGTDSSSNPFSFNSDTVDLVVSGGGPTATPANNGNGSGNGSSGFPSIILYGIIIAVLAVVAVLLVIVLMRRGKKPGEPTAQPSENQPAPSKPDEEKPGAGQDFSI